LALFWLLITISTDHYQYLSDPSYRQLQLFLLLHIIGSSKMEENWRHFWVWNSLGKHIPVAPPMLPFKFADVTGYVIQSPPLVSPCAKIYLTRNILRIFSSPDEACFVLVFPSKDDERNFVEANEWSNCYVCFIWYTNIYIQITVIRISDINFQPH